MQKEIISTRQAVFICTMFIFASNILIGSGSSTEQDKWIVMLLSFVLAIPAIIVYARILDLNPEMGLVQIAEKVLGRIAGKIFILLMTLYAMVLGSIVVSNFYFYVGVTILQDTPHYFVAGLMVLVCVYMAKSGIEVLGKWSYIAFISAMTVLALTLILSFNQYEFDRLLPVGEHKFGELLEYSFAKFSYSFAETVILMFLGQSIRKKQSPYKIYFAGCMIGMFSLLLLVIRNILVLGPQMISAVYSPSYIAARIINISTFLTRVEGSISMNYIVSGVVKISVCLIASAVGFSSLFGVSDYRKLVVPTGILFFALCMINYPGMMDMFSFLEVYHYAVIPFQIVLPVIIWIASEIRAKRDKKNAAKQQPMRSS